MGECLQVASCWWAVVRVGEKRRESQFGWAKGRVGVWKSGEKHANIKCWKPLPRIPYKQLSTHCVHIGRLRVPTLYTLASKAPVPVPVRLQGTRLPSPGVHPRAAHSTPPPPGCKYRDTQFSRPSLPLAYSNTPLHWPSPAFHLTPKGPPTPP